MINCCNAIRGLDFIGAIGFQKVTLIAVTLIVTLVLPSVVTDPDFVHTFAHNTIYRRKSSQCNAHEVVLESVNHDLKCA